MMRSETETVAIQAILFSLSFFITWAPSTIWSIAHWFEFSAFWLDWLSSFCEPLQGFWNLLIFMRTRRSSQRKIKLVLTKLFPCCGFDLTESSEQSVRGGRTSSESTGKSKGLRDSGTPPPTTGEKKLFLVHFADDSNDRTSHLEDISTKSVPMELKAVTDDSNIMDGLSTTQNDSPAEIGATLGMGTNTVEEIDPVPISEPIVSSVVSSSQEQYFL
jgi:hypothetical protein